MCNADCVMSPYSVSVYFIYPMKCPATVVYDVVILRNKYASLLLLLLLFVYTNCLIVDTVVLIRG